MPVTQTTWINYLQLHLILAKNEYFETRQSLCTFALLNVQSLRHCNDRQMVHTYMSKPVYEEGDVTVLWNQAEHTDREVTANRPDIIIKNKKRENMHTESLDIEIQWMWNLKCMIIPLITGANGIVMRSLKKNVEAIPEKKFDRFTTNNSYTWNITHNTKSNAV